MVDFDSQENLSGTWIDTSSRAVYGVRYLLQARSGKLWVGGGGGGSNFKESLGIWKGVSCFTWS